MKNYKESKDNYLIKWKQKYVREKVDEEKMKQKDMGKEKNNKKWTKPDKKII